MFGRLTRLPCKAQYLVDGNHDSGKRFIYKEAVVARGLEEHEEVYPLTVGNLIFVGQSLHIYVGNQSIYMQHYAPYIWPEMSKGGVCCTGHSHSNCPELNPSTGTQRILDVGLDNAIKYNGTPFFSYNEIMAILGKRVNAPRDHH